jgi:hypothetical protein
LATDSTGQYVKKDNEPIPRDDLGRPLDSRGNLLPKDSAGNYIFKDPMVSLIYSLSIELFSPQLRVDNKFALSVQMEFYSPKMLMDFS